MIVTIISFVVGYTLGVAIHYLFPENPFNPLKKKLDNAWEELCEYKLRRYGRDICVDCPDLTEAYEKIASYEDTPMLRSAWHRLMRWAGWHWPRGNG